MLKTIKQQSLREFFLILLFSIVPTSSAYGAGYYDVPEHGRPPSVFSLCCCKKVSEEGEQVIYNCFNVEEEKCPVNTKRYKVNGFDCPSSLIIKKR
ncbi:MAG: hypothetical protein HYY52_04025 [Candidatus Melainabacteria bacterium]|nr:hypothetical protein [Candidatus Melainabacteria bacterium]